MIRWTAACISSSWPVSNQKPHRHERFGHAGWPRALPTPQDRLDRDAGSGVPLPVHPPRSASFAAIARRTGPRRELACQERKPRVGLDRLRHAGRCTQRRTASPRVGVQVAARLDLRAIGKPRARRAASAARVRSVTARASRSATAASMCSWKASAPIRSTVTNGAPASMSEATNATLRASLSSCAITSVAWASRQCLRAVASCGRPASVFRPLSVSTYSASGCPGWPAA